MFWVVFVVRGEGEHHGGELVRVAPSAASTGFLQRLYSRLQDKEVAAEGHSAGLPPARSGGGPSL